MKKLFFLLFCLYSFSALAELTAKIDNANIAENQTFNLEIQSDSTLKGAPDLSPLSADFDIVSQGEKSASFFDGKTHQEQKSIILTLHPKRTGTLTVPVIRWGTQESKPLQIQVNALSKQVQIQNQTAVLIEAAPLTQTAYQGAGFIYRAKVFERVGLIEGAFDAPELKNAEVIPLGSPILSQEKRDDVLYQVVTQDYIIFPDSVGSDLKIEPALFQGYYKKPTPSRQLLPFGFGDDFIYQPLFDNREEVSVRANPTFINVLPKPQEAGKSWWLPSTDVTLNETWSGINQADEIQVGKPITRHIELQAQNALGRMLPDFNIDGNADFKVYPEQAQKKEVYDATKGLIGQEDQSFVFVPLHSGRLTLPAVSLRWFDTVSGTFKTAFLPEKSIFVYPNPAYADKQPIKPNVLPQSTPTEEKIHPLNALYSKENNLLYFFSGLCCGLSFAVIAVIFLHRRHTHTKKLPELYPHEK